MTKNQALWLVYDYLYGLCDYMAVHRNVMPEINELVWDRVWELQFNIGTKMLGPRNENDK